MLIILMLFILIILCGILICNPFKKRLYPTLLKKGFTQNSLSVNWSPLQANLLKKGFTQKFAESHRHRLTASDFTQKRLYPGGSGCSGGNLVLTEDDKTYLSEYFKSEYSDEKIKKRIHKLLNQASGKNQLNRQNIGDIAIDGLNLIHHIKESDRGYLSPSEIYRSISYIGLKLKKFFKGRIMLVLKDEDNNEKNSEKNNEKYKELAKELKIFIYVAVKYTNNAPTWKLPDYISKDAHSQKGRDDFSTIVIARKYNCPMLTNDNYKDSLEFKETIPPFKLLEFNWFSSKLPIVEQYKPENYVKAPWPKFKIKLDHIFMHKELAMVSNN